MEILKIQQLSINFGKNTIIKQSDLIIEKNKIYILIGRNGSGKTTLIKSILGLINYSGQINISPNTKIGYSPEIFNYFKSIKLKKFLQLIQNLEEKNGKKYEKINEIINLLNLQNFENYKISNLSKGTKKRLSIAYSLIGNPNFLLRDEPFDGLDFWERENLLNILNSLHQQGKTFLISTHFPLDFEKLNAKIIKLENGKIIY